MSDFSFTFTIEYIIFSVGPENIKSDKRGARAEMDSLLPLPQTWDKLQNKAFNPVYTQPLLASYQWRKETKSANLASAFRLLHAFRWTWRGRSANESQSWHFCWNY